MYNCLLVQISWRGGEGGAIPYPKHTCCDVMHDTAERGYRIIRLLPLKRLCGCLQKFLLRRIFSCFGNRLMRNIEMCECACYWRKDVLQDRKVKLSNTWSRAASSWLELLIVSSCSMNFVRLKRKSYGGKNYIFSLYRGCLLGTVHCSFVEFV